MKTNLQRTMDGSDALYQWSIAALYCSCRTNTDVGLGLQQSMQNVSNTLPWYTCRFLLSGCLLFTCTSFLFVVLHFTVSSWLQFEILLQFFIGFYDESEVYIDSFRKNAFRYLTAISGFWFDCATSLPWSYNDMQAYRVRVPMWLLESCSNYIG